MRTPITFSLLPLAGFVLAATSLSAMTLHLLPTYSTGGFDYAVGLADDGTVIGSSQDFETTTPILWSNTGTAYSAPQTQSLPAGAVGGELRWVSPDASLLAGFAILPFTDDGESTSTPVVWNRSPSGVYTVTALPRLGSTASPTLLTAGSDSGTRFVGQSGTTPVATVWRGTPASGYTIQALALPSDAAGTSTATALSSNGTRAVGHYETAAGSQAVVWTENSGAYSVAKLQAPAGVGQSFAEVVSRDGALAAGSVETATGLRPVIWNTDTGSVTELETPSGFEATVLSVADNNVWLGGRATDNGGFENTALLWNSTGQVFDLVTLASEAGTAFTDLTPESVTGIHLVSTGHYTIVGTGIDAQGTTQGFVLENIALATPAAEPEVTPPPPVVVVPPDLGKNLSKRRERTPVAETGYASWFQNEDSERTLGNTAARARSR